MPLIYLEGCAPALANRSTLPPPTEQSSQRHHRYGQLCATAPAVAAQFGAEQPSGHSLQVGLDGYLDHQGATDPLPFIARQYRHHGVAALQTLEGNFVIVVIDHGSQRVIALRDRLGGRRICWSTLNQRLALSTRASELLPEDQAGPDHENRHFIARLLGTSNVPKPGVTVFEGVHELRPGETLTWKDGVISLERSPFDFAEPIGRRSTDDWTQRFSETLEHSVATCLGVRGPVASMLSGGLDSGPMTVMACDRLNQLDRSLISISWFLKAYPEADESRPIRRLAEYLGCELKSFSGDEMLPFRNLSPEMMSPDLPVYNSFRELVLSCYRLAAAAGAEVILNGHVGDRIYWPRDYLLSDPWQRGDYRELFSTIGRIVRHTGLTGLWRDPAFRAPLGRLSRKIRPTSQSSPWLTDNALKYLDPNDEPDWPPETADYHLPVRARELLGASMAFGLAHENDFANRFGIERRDPFRNEVLIRLMLQMPASLSHRHGYPKWVMREAMKGRMPERLRLKPRTGLLGSFYDAGFNQHRDNIHDLLFNRNRAWQHYVKPEFIEQALKETNPSKQAKLVINKCVGYALWREYWEKR